MQTPSFRAAEAASTLAVRAPARTGDRPSAPDLRACRASLRRNSRTFHAASLLLPPAVRTPASVLYAFCRIADDTVDIDGGRGDALERLAARIERAYAGRPMPQPADRALAAVVVQHRLPQALLDWLIEGLAWDVEGRRYETLDALQDYAARVAGTVGALMALLMGVRHREALARACELGVAMQLTNIARDVGEDAAAGRLYLPRAWLREAGIEPDAWLARPVWTPALGAVVQRLLDAADTLYARVGAGVAALPIACRPGINAARFLYAEIGREVERLGDDAVARRAHVPGRRKAALLLRAACMLWPDDTARSLPPLPAIARLVDIAASGGLPGEHATGGSWAQVIDLFDRLERRDHGGLAA